MSSGIYIIRCTRNNHLYIGSSTNIQRRIKVHIRKLSNNTHGNWKLQRLFNKYSRSFEFSTLCRCDSNLRSSELNLISLYKRRGFKLLNLTENTISFWEGKSHSIESKNKISKKLKGTKRSDDFKLKISKANTGRKRSEYSKKLNRESHLGKKHTIESRLNISKSLKKTLSKKKLKISKDQRKKISKVLKGRRLSQNTKDKISKSLSGRSLNKNHKRKISESLNGVDRSGNKNSRYIEIDIDTKKQILIDRQNMSLRKLSKKYGYSVSVITRVIKEISTE